MGSDIRSVVAQDGSSQRLALHRDHYLFKLGVRAGAPIVALWLLALVPSLQVLSRCDLVSAKSPLRIALLAKTMLLGSTLIQIILSIAAQHMLVVIGNMILVLRGCAAR